jgi:hypothetical protein
MCGCTGNASPASSPALVGGVEHAGKPSRGLQKCVVLIAVEAKKPKGFERVRMRRVPDASGASLVAFVCDLVDPGAVARTDGWSAYNGLVRRGYSHQRISVSSSGDPAHLSMPGMHRGDYPPSRSPSMAGSL